VLEVPSQRNKHATSDHHDRTEQPVSELLLAQEQTRPEDGEDATQDAIALNDGYVHLTNTFSSGIKQ
jgi:hypothetical protein